MPTFNEELFAAGVSEDMVRLSIGIEHIDDILGTFHFPVDTLRSAIALANAKLLKS